MAAILCWPSMEVMTPRRLNTTGGSIGAPRCMAAAILSRWGSQISLWNPP